MKLNEYLKKIRKSRCPHDCEFKIKEKIEIAFVPPPDKILGVIISRDPTTNWLEKHYKKEKKSRKNLFDSAIPSQLIERIRNFMANNITEKDKKHISEFIYKNVYWTHLHKCFTDKSGKKSIKFKNTNANKCADKWLTEELKTAINDNTKFIIVLGNDVKKWIYEWREDYCRNKNIEIFHLPHPSGENVGRGFSWYPKETKVREKIKNRIDRLLKLCKTVV
ncbi:MAG: uracil-DNA glycosylase family protein [Elusimicrobiota bacterium]|nr:uracil-DNA glycosylase family protein [Elusimicrobiota bacterium]